MVDKVLAGMTMLIVEDEAIVCMGLEYAFLDAGADDVIIAPTLRKAENYLHSADFDAAVIDLCLTDGDAFDLGAELIAKGIPVVVHSGHADIKDIDRLPHAVFCQKPCLPDEIITAIQRARSRVACFA